MVNYASILQKLSFYAGNRFDLVQAGGGNTSVKISDTEMLVKNSGISLSEVTEESGFVAVNYQRLRDFLDTTDFSKMDKKQRESVANREVINSKLSETGKPSIETLLHALLSTYTLHTHPVAVNILAATSNWRSDLLNVCPDAVCVPYHTPGIDLALAMLKEINIYKAQHGHIPKIIFLQNHGLIVSSADAEEIPYLSEKINASIEKNIGIDLTRYKKITPLQVLYSESGYKDINIICNDDEVINNCILIEKKSTEIWPFCPDTLIYCGVRPLFIEHEEDYKSIQSYINNYHDFPKVLILNKQIYFCANSIKKAKEAQDLLRFHLLVVQHTKDKTQRLEKHEVAYLSNWDAEKYRQGV